MSRDWSPRTREHTFSTGRTATLRMDLLTSDLIERGLLERDMLQTLGAVATGEEQDLARAAELQRVLCIGLFASPKIGDEAVQDAEGEWVVVPFDALEQSEVTETTELALESLLRIATFRDERGGDGVGEGREGVGRPAKRARRSDAGKRRGAPSGQGSGGANGDGAVPTSGDNGTGGNGVGDDTVPGDADTTGVAEVSG